MRAQLTTASCLLALMSVVATQSAHAQRDPSSDSGNKKSVKANDAADDSDSESSRNAQTGQSPVKSRLFTRVGYVVVPYHSSTTISTNGQPLSGGSAQASNNMTLVFDIGYEVTKNFFVLVTSGIPVKPHVTGEGTAASLGILGKVRYGPAMFTGHYRFPRLGRFRPYVGGGAAYAIIFKEFDGSVKNLKVNNNWGSVIEGGTEYQVNSQYTLFVDFKEVWLAVNARGVLSDSTDVKARVKLNPSLITVGIKFHFPFGRGQ